MDALLSNKELMRRSMVTGAIFILEVRLSLTSAYELCIIQLPICEVWPVLASSELCFFMFFFLLLVAAFSSTYFNKSPAHCL